MRDLHGKKALVTGAASGIGRAIALELAGHGVDVCLLDVDDQGLEETAEAVDQLGVSVATDHCDLLDPQQITASCRRILSHWGGLDILVNNAGVSYYGPTLNMEPHDWDRILGVNLHAPLQLTRELLPTLLDRPQGHILNMASICGLVGGDRLIAYQTTKFAIVGLTESLRAEFGRHGLGVTAVCPGPVLTNLLTTTPTGGRKRLPVPPRWICSTPEHVARKSVQAIRRDRRLVLVGPLAHLLSHTKRWAPWLLDSLSRIGRRKRIRKKQQKYADLAARQSAEQLRAAPPTKQAA